MKFLVLGAGRVGYAMAYDLIRSPRVEQIIVLDREPSKVQSLVERMGDPKIVPAELDLDCVLSQSGEELDLLLELMGSVDVTLSCLPVDLNYDLAKTALRARCHFCDLGGSSSTVKKEFLLDEIAREQEVTIIPDLGLSPGLVSILANATISNLDELYEVRIRVGTMPAEKEEDSALFGQIFSIDSAFDRYTGNCKIVRDGATYLLPALSDVELVDFPKPIGTLEAFNVSGGVTTLLDNLEGKISHLDFKELQYPGFSSSLTLLRDLGLLDTERVELGSGTCLSPRELLYYQLGRKARKQFADLAILRITVTGLKDKKPVQCVWDGIAYGDEAAGISAAAKLNAYTASIIAQMIARGDITARGVLSQEEHVPIKLFLPEISSRGISLTLTEKIPQNRNLPRMPAS